MYLWDSAIRGTGNTANNRIEGNHQNNILDGGAGTDTLIGGLGDDTYIIDTTADVITESSGAGTDTVQSTVTYTLGSNLENLTLTGSNAINGTGNTLNNVLTGNTGNNTLNGGAGNDTLIGGFGNDTYTVDSTSDVVTELAGEGTDLVNASVSYTLSANVENLTLTGTSGLTATGNAESNVLTGNSGANTLNGGAGNDTLNGGTGIDTMVGGTGNDTYFVDSTSEVITELAGEGTDTISAGITYDLTSRANVENLTLTGSTAINGTGNSLDNVLIGNSANNTLTGNAGNDTLDGGSGTDTMRGGTGNDLYYVNVSTDVVTENANEGNDTVNASITYSISALANIENITLTGTSAINATGNASANVLIGNSANNTLTGNAGNDTLQGMAGTDTLTGGTGNDTYVMNRGYGADTAVDTDTTAGNYDIAQFLTGVSFDQLWFKRPSGSNNLEITIIGTNDKLTVKDWYLGTQYRVEEIKVNDGNRYLLAADVQALVTAMAGMTQPALGQTTLTAAQQTQLASTFASTWKTTTSLMATSTLPADTTQDVSQTDSADASLRRILSSALPAEPSSESGPIKRMSTSVLGASEREAGPLPGNLRRIAATLPAIDQDGMAADTLLMRTMASALPPVSAPAEAIGMTRIAPKQIAPMTSSQPSVLAAPDAALATTDWPVMAGGTLAELVPFEAMPTKAICGLPSNDEMGVISDCHRLIDLMAMNDRQGHALAATALLDRPQVNTWMP